MNSLKTYYTTIFVLVFMGHIWAQKSTYLEVGTSFGSDIFKLRNFEGRILEKEIVLSYTSSLSLGITSPLYKSLRFRSDFIIFQSETYMNIKYEYNDLLVKDTRKYNGWFYNQSIMNAHGVEYHYSKKRFIFSGQLQNLIGLDIKKDHAGREQNYFNPLRVGFLLGTHIKYIGKYMGVGLGVNYIHFAPEALFNNLPTSGLTYSSRSFMRQLTISYKLNGTN